MSKEIEVKVVKRTKVEQPMTLLKAIERVVEVSKDSKLKAEAKAMMADEVRYLAERFGISELQAILFCICMEKGPRRVDYDDLASHLDLSKIRILRYASDIDALVHRRLLRYRDAKEEDDFDEDKIEDESDVFSGMDIDDLDMDVDLPDLGDLGQDNEE